MATGTAGLAAKLIEGAGMATEGPEEWVSQTNQAKYAEANQKVISAGGEMIATLMAKKQEKEEAEKAKQLGEWDKLANAAIEDSQYMTEDEYSTLTKQLEADRELFINASKEEKAILLNNMETKRDEIENVKNFRVTLSTSATEEDGIKGNQDWLLSSDGMEYKDILSGNKSMIEQEGKYGYMMYDASIQENRKSRLTELEAELLIATDSGDDASDIKTEIETLTSEINEADINPRGDQTFMTVYDMEQVINHQSFDREINNKAVEFATNAQTLGASVPQGSAANFNYESTETLVTNEIINKGNIRSLTYDKHIGGVSFAENLQKAINNKTYAELGIDEATLNAEDPTPDGVISESDAEVITQKLLNNKNMVKDYLTTYFTNFIQKNYQDGYNSRPIPASALDEGEFAS